MTAALCGLLLAGAAGPAAAAPVPLAPTAPHSHLTLAVAARVPPGARAPLTGHVTPGHAGRRLQLQVEVAGRWQRVATARVSRRSTYTFHRTYRTAGAVETLRVVLPAHRDHRVGISRARTVRTVAPGFDVSYPQCGAVLPAGAPFTLIGVDGGKPFDVNGCLAQQIAWALPTGAPAYYVNTANPGPQLSSFWPSGQASPRACAATYPANDSTACAFDYGWNAAASSYARASAAAASVGAPGVSLSTWWLDVELRNTWEAEQPGAAPRHLRHDLAVLQGMSAYLKGQGVRTVGVYSTGHQWDVVTGGARWSSAPVWYAGVGSPTSALAHCAVSFTGGPVRMAQYASRAPAGLDADHRC